MSGYKSAVKYGYSNARVKAMQARLLGQDTVRGIASAPDMAAVLTALFQTDYKDSITAFGGLEIKSELIDFALSRELARAVDSLVRIAPYIERTNVVALVSRWDLYNVKLAIEAKDRGLRYEAFSSNVIDHGRYNAVAIKEAMEADSVEALIAKLMMNSRYVSALQAALDSYKGSHDATEAIARIDQWYYAMVSKTITSLRVAHQRSAAILKMEIDKANLMALLMAKRHGADWQAVAGRIIGHGNMQAQRLESLYQGSGTVEELAQQVTEFNLADGVAAFKRTGRLLPFEITINTGILVESMRMLRHSVLSLDSIIAYAFLKEIEVMTIRTLIKGRQYNIAKEEMDRLMAWRA